ncbi:MAG: DNA-processing protein DprA [Micavibrio sp.]
MSLFPAPQRALPLDEKERIARLRLIRTENVGPITFYGLLDRFGSAQKAMEALPSLSRKGGRLQNLTLHTEEAALAEMEALQSAGGTMVFAGDKHYPLPLSSIEDAPPVLSVLGNPKLLNLPSIGIVGSRNASLNGCKFAEKLARELGAAGQMVVSGLARGIDTAAHKGALATGTIAVVAGGIDIIYPPENRALYGQIASEGCIVAENPLRMEPLARHFPKRNRIISGLAAGVAVIEATLKSGSLITARTAAEQGRDVYAVPGHPFDPRAAGPNRLLQDGATMVQSARDILDNIVHFSGSRPALEEEQHGFSPAPFPDEDTAPAFEEGAADLHDLILQNISLTPITVDELVRNCHVSIPALQSVLLELELAGRIQKLPSNRIVLIN